MRLIDADRYREEWMKMDSFEPMKLLDMQPTAYDIEKVTDKLIEGSYKIYADDELSIELDRAIEIVKNGAIN